MTGHRRAWIVRKNRARRRSMSVPVLLRAMAYHLAQINRLNRTIKRIYLVGE